MRSDNPNTQLEGPRWYTVQFAVRDLARDTIVSHDIAT